MQEGFIQVLHEYAYSNLRLDRVLEILQDQISEAGSPLSSEDATTVQATSLGAWLHSHASCDDL